MICRWAISTEKTLMIEIAAAEESYERRAIDKIGGIRSGDNVADAITKHKRCPCVEDFLPTGHVRVDVCQWVNRSGKDASPLDSRIDATPKPTELQWGIYTRIRRTRIFSGHTDPLTYMCTSMSRVSCLMWVGDVQNSIEFGLGSWQFPSPNCISF